MYFKYRSIFSLKTENNDRAKNRFNFGSQKLYSIYVKRKYINILLPFLLCTKFPKQLEAVKRKVCRKMEMPYSRQHNIYKEFSDL